MFSSDIIIANNSLVSTTAMGCNSDLGPGKGKRIFHQDNSCAGTGGSYGGTRGYGLGVDESESIACMNFALELDYKEDNIIYGDIDNPIFEVKYFFLILLFIIFFFLFL
jgi:hypothetical protein